MKLNSHIERCDMGWKYTDPTKYAYEVYRKLIQSWFDWLSINGEGNSC